MDGSFNYIENLGWSLDAEAKRMNGAEEDEMDEEYTVDEEQEEREEPVNETQVESMLYTLLEQVQFMEAEDMEQFGLSPDLKAVAGVLTFNADHLLTDDKGIVLQLTNGQEYQITIKRSK